MRRKVIPFMLLTVVMLLTACIDKSYDLDDIDLTLSTDVNLAMPLISTSEIKLADFLIKKTDENKFIRTTTISGQDGDVLYAYASGNITATIPASTLKNGDVEFTAEILDIEIPELPDFLKDENVHFDLVNPIIIANIESNLPNNCTVLTDMEVYTSQASCTIEKIKATKGKQCQYIASEKDEHIPSELLTKTPELLVPKAGDINELFSNGMPKKLQIKINKVAASGVTSTPSENINISVGLSLYAPLRIGPKFCLVYTATDSEWSEEFNNDIKKMKIDMLTLNANLTNSLPVDVYVTIVPTDPEGNDIDGLDAINANASASSANKVSYILKANKPGLTLRDYINGSNGAQQLDGVRIVSMLKANDSSVGNYITTKSFARFTDIELRAKGQFIYDAN